MGNLSRRQWLQSLLPAAGEAVARSVEARIDRALPPQRRPPGAAHEASFLAACTRCDECVQACPHDAIHLFREDAGFLAGTPVMVPDSRPCHMCEGFPCVAACDEGALAPPATTTWELGSVRVAESRCIAFSGPDCGACAGRCPGESNALELQRGKPAIDRESCVGCGLCIEACPVIPAALELVPLES